MLAAVAAALGVGWRTLAAAAFTPTGMPWLAGIVITLGMSEWLIVQSGLLSQGSDLRDAADAVHQLRALEHERGERTR